MAVGRKRGAEGDMAGGDKIRSFPKQQDSIPMDCEINLVDINLH